MFPKNTIQIFLIISYLHNLVKVLDSKTIHYSLTVSYLSVALDGVTKRMLVFNNLSPPGPTLQASKGDELLVKVTNRIDPDETTTIHWHGIEQFYSPFQDGPRMITQCDIPYNYSHTYRFILHQSGTYWYHAHHTGHNRRSVGCPNRGQHSSRSAQIRWRVCPHSKRLVSPSLPTVIELVRGPANKSWWTSLPWW